MVFYPVSRTIQWCYIMTRFMLRASQEIFKVSLKFESDRLLAHDLASAAFY